jgi:hypothetical protein
MGFFGAGIKYCGLLATEISKKISVAAERNHESQINLRSLRKLYTEIGFGFFQLPIIIETGENVKTFSRGLRKFL